MSELGPEGSALLRAARGVDDDEVIAARERNRGPLGRRLGAAAVGLTAVTAATTAQAGVSSAVSAGLAFKVVVGLASLGLVVGGVAYSQRPTPAPITAAASPVVTAAKNTAPVVAAATTAPVIAPVTAPVIAPVPPVPSHAAAPVVPKVAAVDPKPPATPPSLDGEIAALRRANDALAGGQPTQALAILDATPSSGTFYEERTGLRALANCTLGYPGARDAATSFLAAHPSSPLAARLRTRCSIP